MTGSPLSVGYPWSFPLVPESYCWNRELSRKGTRTWSPRRSTDRRERRICVSTAFRVPCKEASRVSWIYAPSSRSTAQNQNLKWREISRDRRERSFRQNERTFEKSALKERREKRDVSITNLQLWALVGVSSSAANSAVWDPCGRRYDRADISALMRAAAEICDKRFRVTYASSLWNSTNLRRRSTPWPCIYACLYVYMHFLFLRRKDIYTLIYTLIESDFLSNRLSAINLIR